jgi:hypothetical protein
MPGVVRNLLGTEGAPTSITSDSVPVYGNAVDLYYLAAGSKLAFMGILTEYSDTSALISLEGTNCENPQTGIWVELDANPLPTMNANGAFAKLDFALNPLRWLRVKALLSGGTSAVSAWVSAYFVEDYN